MREGEEEGDEEFWRKLAKDSISQEDRQRIKDDVETWYKTHPKALDRQIARQRRREQHWQNAVALERTPRWQSLLLNASLYILLTISRFGLIAVVVAVAIVWYVFGFPAALIVVASILGIASLILGVIVLRKHLMDFNRRI